MRYFFRPSILIALSAVVVVVAIVVVFQGPPAQGHPLPLPVRDDEREIVWLYPATSAASWQRFVAAVRRTAERLQGDRPGLQADDKNAFPSQTTTVPEVSLSGGRVGPRFVFRWYKLTGDWKTRDWVEALLERKPPPLAILGGSSSDGARELALHLCRSAEKLPVAERPLLLLTSATADRVAGPSADEMTTAAEVKLTQLYPGRTFRFCFSNEQMADAVSDFIWSRKDLCPQSDPVYMAMWNDDSYSRDLVEGFRRALPQVVARDRAGYWFWIFNQLYQNLFFGAGGGVLPVQRLQVYPGYSETVSSFSLQVPPRQLSIDSSVGSFATPNSYEAKAAGEMLDHWAENRQNRPLLILAGQSQPSRRFLRGLMRGSPSLSKRVEIVVATGDAVSFNTVYRDREVAWNIQDLPFPLVFFCHRNPIDADAGFRAGTNENRRGEDERDNTAETGTEDVLLFGDIVEALVQTAAPAQGAPCESAGELAERRADVRRQDDRIVFGGEGVRLFDGDGQRRNGTGEHVVCLKPMWNEDYPDRLLPCASIEVWGWPRRDWSRGERGQHWMQRGQPLTVWYNDPAREGGGERGGP